MKITTSISSASHNVPINHDDGSSPTSNAPQMTQQPEVAPPSNTLGTQPSSLKTLQRNPLQAQLIEQLNTHQQPTSQPDVLEQRHTSELATPNTKQPVTFKDFPGEVLEQVPSYIPVGDKDVLNFSLTNKLFYVAATAMREKSASAYAETLMEKGNNIYMLPDDQEKIAAFNAIKAKAANMTGKPKSYVLRTLASIIRSLPEGPERRNAFNAILHESATLADGHRDFVLEELARSIKNLPLDQAINYLDRIGQENSLDIEALVTEMLQFQMVSSSVARSSAADLIMVEVPTISNEYNKVSVLCALADSTAHFPVGAWGNSFNGMMSAASNISKEGKLALLSDLSFIVRDRPNGQEKTDALYAIGNEVANMKSVSDFTCPSQIFAALMHLPDCPERTRLFKAIF